MAKKGNLHPYFMGFMTEEFMGNAASFF
uniref:Uncharacterized protein n=1 Tax=Rhizophora mucronata TaxID=61149 RepID=A0A2P2Q8K5_RHIMU